MTFLPWNPPNFHSASSKRIGWITICGRLAALSLYTALILAAVVVVVVRLFVYGAAVTIFVLIAAQASTLIVSSLIAIRYNLFLTAVAV
jgi:hypothetical protein